MTDKVSYGHGQLYEFYNVDGFSESGDTGNGSFSSDGDVVSLVYTGSSDYFIDNDSPLGLYSSTYTTITGRYKTSNNSVKAEVVVTYQGGSPSNQTVLAETSSTTWKHFSDTLDTGVIDTVRLHANGASGTVDYDFILIHQGYFTFPSNQPTQVDFYPCPPKMTNIDVWGRSGDVTQGGATRSGYMTMTCDLDIGDWTRTGDSLNGDVFIDIAHNSKDEAWQWLEVAGYKFKANLDSPRFSFRGDKHLAYLTWREYRTKSADSETWYDRYGIGDT